MTLRNLVVTGFAVIATLSALPTTTMAESWVLVHADENNWTFLDVDSIERSGQAVTAWQVDIPRNVYFRGDQQISHYASQGRRECLASTLQWLQSAVIGYDGANLGGSTSPTETIQLSAEGARRMKGLCSGSEFEGPRFASLDEVLVRFRKPAQ